jgi:hypothetical protein
VDKHVREEMKEYWEAVLEELGKRAQQGNDK